MPKNPLKGFTRRKSSGNVLDLQPEVPAVPAVPVQSSFRVLERPNKAGFDGGDKLHKRLSTFGSPAQHSRGKSAEDLGASTNRSVKPPRPHTIYGVLKEGRSSGGTTLSGSSGYYDTSSSSARYSSSSTLPSSLDAEHEADQDDLFPRKAATPVDHYKPSGVGAHDASPSFAARAGRAMSFGRNKHHVDASPVPAPPPVPSYPDNSFIRDRATTISSYASTAVPPRLDPNMQSSDFGSDFGNMFEGLAGPKRDDVLPPPPVLGGFARSESEPLFPPRAASRGTTPSPELEIRHRPQQLAPSKRYSWASRNSNDGLMSPVYDSEVNSPVSARFTAHDNPVGQTGFGRFKPGYQAVPDRYSSPVAEIDESQSNRFASRPVSTSSTEDNVNLGRAEDMSNGIRPIHLHPMSRSHEVLPSAQPNPQTAPTQPVPSIAEHSVVADANTDNLSSAGSMSAGSSLGRESQEATPRAKKLEPQPMGDSLFDVSPVGPASRAVPRSILQTRSGENSPKKMTSAQFEKQRATVGFAQEEESDESDHDGYDDGDEAERHAALARQRRKQEANMAVYRQQMKKVSGGNPLDLPSQGIRPSLDRAAYSAPGLVQSMSGMALDADNNGEDEDDDVPLGILQAHGFPNKNRPPVRLASGLTSPSGIAPSVIGDAAGNLPPFARRLPADPYFGASIVSPSNREPLAFGNSGGSVYGGASPAHNMQPGGLVGVIAGEERARAARRGSPMVSGGYGPIPLPSAMAPSMMPRSPSAMNMMGPQMGQMGGFMSGMPPMMSPSEYQTQQQMMQMMAMQQQMMQQMMAMQGQMPQFDLPQMPSHTNGFLNAPNGTQRPMSIVSNGRSMTMLNPPPQWNDNAQQQRSNTMSNLQPPGYAGSMYGFSMQGPSAGYTPSIAPSERTNIGMPSRYRPVMMDGSGSNSRTQTMTTEGPTQASTQGSTIRVIDKPRGAPKASQPYMEDEDEEEGWAVMRKRRQERKRRTIEIKTEQALNELYHGLE